MTPLFGYATADKARIFWPGINVSVRSLLFAKPPIMQTGVHIIAEKLNASLLCRALYWWLTVRRLIDHRYSADKSQQRHPVIEPRVEATLAKKLDWRYSVGRPYRIAYSVYPKASIRLPVAERRQFPRATTVPYTRYSDAAISDTTINAGILYGNSADVCDGCRQQLSV